MAPPRVGEYRKTHDQTYLRMHRITERVSYASTEYEVPINRQNKLLLVDFISTEYCASIIADRSCCPLFQNVVDK